MGSPILFAGNTAKLLKSTLDFFGQSQILSGTTDPSSVATSAPKGSLYLNSSSGTLYRKTDAGSSTNWAVVTDSTPPRSSVQVSDSGGHGSTATKIRRFTTTNQSTGTGITFASDATNGATFTINETGVYSIHYWDGRAVAVASFGISVNSASLTTNITSLSYANGFRDENQSILGGIGLVSATLILTATDVVRAQTDGTPDNTGTSVGFIITKVSN